MPIELVPLPYARTALEPHLSEATLQAHYDGHQHTDVEQLNACIAGTALAQLTLEEIVAQAQGKRFDLAAQVWNHNFYWQCLRPRGGGEPIGRLAGKIAQCFGDFAQLREQFNYRALASTGSGWIWLVQRSNETLAVVTTPNACTPCTGPDTPLLTCDLWEHAYYLDHRQDRAQYLEAFWKLVNWDFVASGLVQS